ncbi:conserved Plasmodium protein, unknown function [Plasmodium ovale wallikeri]|uniref:Uncharacterized protein n=3 Tax=Plasmodium ovale TaxID=36330 RepID=A0A1A8YSE1_PLAOA|nr:conserved Plasmodium protein, unknown function [Plasmodium ovale wallikeri]
MLEKLCNFLLYELLRAKYHLLLSLQLGKLHKKKVVRYGRDTKKRRKRVRSNEQGLGKNNQENTPFMYIPPINENEKYCTNFGKIKKKRQKKKKKKQVIFKKLRKQIVHIDEYYKTFYNKKKKNVHSMNEQCNDFILLTRHHNQKLLWKLFKYEKRNFFFYKNWSFIFKKEKCILNKTSWKRKNGILYNCNKRDKKEKQRYHFASSFDKGEYYFDLYPLPNELGKYLYKDFYTSFPQYNFGEDKEQNESKRLTPFTKSNDLSYMLSRKKEIKTKVYAKNRKSVYLSSKKLNKNYLYFLENLHLLLNKAKIYNGGDTQKVSEANANLLKTCLILKGSHAYACSGHHVCSYCGRGNDKLCRAFSMIQYLRKSMYIIKMDIMYIFIFFTTYIRDIFAKWKSTH